MTDSPNRVEARVSHRFDQPAERVYDAWLDPAGIRLWMAAALKTMGLPGEIRRIEVDPRVGGRFFFSDLRPDGEARHWGTFLELERPTRIVFTWITDPADEANPSKVTLTIRPDGAGCVATVVHQMDRAWADYRDKVADGWGRMLAGVATTIQPG